MKRTSGLGPSLAETAAWLVLAGLAYLLTFEFSEPLPVYRFGASGWPRALIVLLAGVALGQLAKRLGWLGRVRGDASVGVAATGTADVRMYLKRAGMFALPLIYVFLLPGIGYYVLTPFFLSGYMLLFGERRLLHLMGTSLVLHGLVALVFTRYLFVQFPVGVWPVFYELNNRLIAVMR